MSCEDVPLDWRQLYAVACYLYLRPGELRALLWTDVDFDAGVIHVTKAYDEDSQATKPPKTRNGVRDVPIPAALVPLLKVMRDRAADDGAPVVPLMGGAVREPSLGLDAPTLRSRERDALAPDGTDRDHDEGQLPIVARHGHHVACTGRRRRREDAAARRARHDLHDARLRENGRRPLGQDWRAVPAATGRAPERSAQRPFADTSRARKNTGASTPV